MRKLFVLVLTAVLAVGSMSAAHAKAKYSVTITASTAKIDLGKTVKLTGKVSPSAKGKTVKVQRRYAGGSWATVATAKLSSSSSYSVTVKPTRGGPTYYRVQKSGTSSRGTGTSTTKTLDVYRWLDLVLTQTDYADGPGASGATSTINGAEFGHSLIPDSGIVTIGWDLTKRACDKYRMHVGVLPGSDPSAVSSFGVGLYTSSAYLNAGSVPLDLTLNMKVTDYARYLSRPFPSTANKHFGIQVFTGAMSQSVVAEPSVHCNANS